MPSLPDGLAIRLLSAWRNLRRGGGRLARHLAASPRRRIAGGALALVAVGVVGYALRPAGESQSGTHIESPTTFADIEFGGLPTVVVAAPGEHAGRMSGTRRSAGDWRDSPLAGESFDRDDPDARFAGERVRSAHYERTTPVVGGVWLTGTIEDTSDRRETAD
ncbi:MAG: hypothetical protein WD066_15095 [Planctomycetaceae bacterium]